MATVGPAKRWSMPRASRTTTDAPIPRQPAISRSSAGSLTIAPRRVVEDPALELADLGIDRHPELARLARETDSLDRRASGGQRGQQPGQRFARQVGAEVDHGRRDRRIEPEELAGPCRPRDGDRLAIDRQARGHVRGVAPGPGRAPSAASIRPACRAGPGGRHRSGRSPGLAARQPTSTCTRRRRRPSPWPASAAARPSCSATDVGRAVSTRATGRGRDRRLRRVRPAGRGAARSGARRSPRPAGRSPASRQQRIEPERALDRSGQWRPVVAELPQADRGDRHQREVEAQALPDPGGLAACHLAMDRRERARGQEWRHGQRDEADRGGGRSRRDRRRW